MRRLKRMPPSAFPDKGEWPRAVLGNPRQVHERLMSMADALRLDELMLITVVHDPSARAHSYELLAEAFGLVAATTAEI
jgi:alkanesulfonate monooxygenase SsuD/methylene tetrahydromethanopterin reductase-like flavin-dependent oxidoreductase (luciferase family)